MSMTEKQGKNKVRLPERRREVGDLPPGVGTSDVPWEAGRAAGRKGHPGCQPCFLHPGPPQDSLHTHTQPRRPQTSISSLILQPPTEIPLAQRIAKRGCFAQAPFFPRGWPSCLLPLFWKFSYMIALLFLIGGLSRVLREYTTGLVSVTAQTPFDKQLKSKVRQARCAGRSCPPYFPPYAGQAQASLW